MTKKKAIQRARAFKKGDQEKTTQRSRTIDKVDSAEHAMSAE